MRRERIFFVLLCSAFFFSGQTQAEPKVDVEKTFRDISFYFKTAPESILPELDTDMRLDLIDFYTDNKRAATVGRLGATVILKQLSEDYILLQLSSRSDLQIKLLHERDSIVLAVVHTVYAPAKDSYILYYSTSWKLLPDHLQPKINCSFFWNFATFDSLNIPLSKEEVCAANYYEYRFVPGYDRLEVISSAKTYFGKELFEQLAPAFRRDTVVLEPVF